MRLRRHRSTHPIRGDCGRPGQSGNYTRIVTRELADDPGLQTVLTVGQEIKVSCVCGVALRCNVSGVPSVRVGQAKNGGFVVDWPVEVVAHE